MKILDIAIKDMRRSFRSAIALVFMFGIPLLMTSMFYFMFGGSARSGEFELARIDVVIANLDEGGPKLQSGSENLPGGQQADTLGELVVAVMQSEGLQDLLAISLAPDAAAARQAVDTQQAKVAIIIPPDFSQQFSDLYGKAEVEYYQDPTLTIGPSIVKSIMNQFMDRIAGIKIAVDVSLEQLEGTDAALIATVIQQYLNTSTTQTKDIRATLLDIRPVNEVEKENEPNPVVAIIGPIMGGMMIFYAFYTGTTSAESILREEEEGTMPRMFTTPTPQAVILAGKFLSVFFTVTVQVVVLLIASHYIFAIQWGQLQAVALTALGTILSASAFGIFINSMLRNTRQGGVIFGGVLSLTGMLGMIGIFAMNSPAASTLSNSVALLVPQGWAVRALMQGMNAAPLSDILLSALGMLVWGIGFFIAGVWRFNRRYA